MCFNAFKIKTFSNKLLIKYENCTQKKALRKMTRWFFIPLNINRFCVFRNYNPKY